MDPTACYRARMSTPELVTRRTALRLTPTTLVQFLPGVGPRRAEALARLGISSLEDLLRHVPRDYLDARRTVPIARLVPGELVTVVGRVTYARVRQARGRSDLVTRVADPSGVLGVHWFGQGFLARTARGRAATDRAYEHLGKDRPKRQRALF